MPLVSVVLAVCNGGDHLEASVRSVLDQTLADFELIVVDDGSTDGTGDILAALQRADERITVLRHENRGLAASLNAGIARARGRYIARQDADDLSLPDRFTRQAAYLDAHQSVAALGTRADVIDASGAITGALTVAFGPAAVRRGLLTLRSTPVHGSMMMRAGALATAGGYREAFRAAQDYDLWLRLSASSDIDNLPETLYRWRLDRGGVYATRRGLQLKYAGIALAFARERASRGADSYEAFARSGGDLDQFVERYADAPFVHAVWGELLLRGLGNSAGVRRHLRRAAFGGHLTPRVAALLGWTHLGLPWPGGRPLTAAAGGDVQR